MVQGKLFRGIKLLKYAANLFLMDKNMINFAVIGAGRFAKNHIRVLQEFKNIKLIGVASRTKESLDSIETIIPKDAARTTDVYSILNNKDVDCVIISTPPSTHFEIARAAIKAGKHVLLEKPMAANLKEAVELKKIVRSQNKVFMVAHQYIYNGYVRHLKSDINQMGKINFVFAEHLYPGPMRNDIGCLWDAGTHQLSMMQYLFNPGNIKNVTGKSIDLTGNKLDDFTSCLIEFENGLKASITVSWIFPERARKFIVFGEKSAAVFDDILENDKLKFYNMISKNSQSRSLYSESFEKIQVTPAAKKINAGDPLKNQLSHFIGCINNKKEPETNIEKSFQITEWLDKISRGIRLPGYK